MTNHHPPFWAYIVVALAIWLAGWLLVAFGPRWIVPDPPAATPVVTVLPTAIPAPTLVTLTAGDATTKTPTAAVEPILTPQPTMTASPTSQPTMTPEPPTATPAQTPVQRG
jgi:hypothetical protein